MEKDSQRNIFCSENSRSLARHSVEPSHVRLVAVMGFRGYVSSQMRKSSICSLSGMYQTL